MLARNPGSTALIAGLLALGIGACTAIFGLFDAVLLQPLPVRHPEELVRMVQHLPKLGKRSSFPYAYYRALHDHAKTLAITLGETDADYRFRLTSPEPAEEIGVRGVTPEFFKALGVRALYGRALQADDASRNSGMPPAVLSYGFWQRRFGGDPHVVRGKTLSIKGHRFQIVGIMPRDFNGISVDTTPDLRIPLGAFPLLANSRLEATNLELAGRFKPGSTRAQAAAECLAIWQATMKDYYRSSKKSPPGTVSALLKRGMALESLERGVSVIRDRFAGVLKLIMASNGLLVLIVCANVAGLLLARGSARQQELALRLALGATKLRVARQLVLESILMAVLGAAGGLLAAFIATPVALRLLPPMRDLATNPVTLSVNARIDGRAFLFLLALSVLTTVAFAVGPALAASRLSLNQVLRTSRASASLRLRQVLIAFEIALCTFLLAAAGLLVRTFQQLRDTNPGFK